MSIPSIVYKAHATGNDFVVYLDAEGTYEPTADEVRFLCDRHFGIGGDGLIRLTHPQAVSDLNDKQIAVCAADNADWFMDYRNADGSLAEMCGNGTRAITIARAAFRVITGAFINLQAVAGYCVRHKRDVVVLCSGWQDKVNIEDTLFGGALTDVLLNTGLYEMGSDAAVIARDMWTSNKEDLFAYLETTDHMGRLKANHLEEAVPYCLTLSITDKVPELSIEGDTLILC